MEKKECLIIEKIQISLEKKQLEHVRSVKITIKMGFIKRKFILKDKRTGRYNIMA
jgi:hypothetical protein